MEDTLIMEGILNEPHIDITVDDNKIIEGAIEIIKNIRPWWPVENLEFKSFTNGISNKLVGVWYPEHYNEMVLVRVYGYKTDLLVDRKNEIKNIQILNKVGYTHSIFATFNNGFAYEFLKGETLTTETVRQPHVYHLIAKRMAQMHLLKSNYSETDTEAFIWKKTESLMRLMPKKFSDSLKQSKYEQLIEPNSVLKQEYEILKDQLSKLNSPVVYCHNDLLLGNILYDEKQASVTFIDYEYTANNYQAYDIANHFAEFAGIDEPDFSLYPDERFQRAWLKVYIQQFTNTKEEIREADIDALYKQVKKFVLLCHFFWGCWALIQSENSNIEFDFLEYAAMRFNEYFKLKSFS